MIDLYKNTLTTSFKNRIQINKISKLLTEHFDLTYFYCYNVRNNGDYSYFSNRMDWNEDYFKCFEKELHWFKPCNRPQGFGIKILSGDDHRNQMAKVYDIKYSLEFGNTTKDGFEYYGFGTIPSVNNSENRVLNEIPLLKLFIKQIKHKYSLIFDDLNTHRINIEPIFDNKFHKVDHLQSCSMDKLNFLKSIDLNINAHLSRRESEVASFLIKGCSAAEIGEHLVLSKRTVESYIITMKQKLNCYSKSELIEKCLDLDSINFFS